MPAHTGWRRFLNHTREEICTAGCCISADKYKKFQLNKKSNGRIVSITTKHKENAAFQSVMSRQVPENRLWRQRRPGCGHQWIITGIHCRAVRRPASRGQHLRGVSKEPRKLLSACAAYTRRYRLPNDWQLLLICWLCYHYMCELPVGTFGHICLDLFPMSLREKLPWCATPSKGWYDTYIICKNGWDNT